MTPAPAARATARPGTGVDAVTLALVLVLVAFFAVIAANAERSARREAAVLASLSASFGGIAAGPGAVEGGRAWAGLVEALQQAVGSTGTVQARSAGGALRVLLPDQAVFLGDGASPDPRSAPLLDALGAALAGGDAPAGVTVAALSGDPALAARRAARLAYELAARGLDPALLAAAAGSGSGLVLTVAPENPA